MNLIKLSSVCVSRNLRKTENRKNKLEEQLNSVGAKVNELKEKYVSVWLLGPLILSYSVRFHLWNETKPSSDLIFGLQMFAQPSISVFI